MVTVGEEVSGLVWIGRAVSTGRLDSVMDGDGITVSLFVFGSLLHGV